MDFFTILNIINPVGFFFATIYWYLASRKVDKQLMTMRTEHRMIERHLEDCLMLINSNIFYKERAAND